MDHLKEMNKFLQKHNIPGLNQEETGNINRTITSTELETVIKNLPTNKTPGPDGFTGEFYQISREDLTPILLKLFQNFSFPFQMEEQSKTHSTRPPSPRYQNQKKLS